MKKCNLQAQYKLLYQTDFLRYYFIYCDLLDTQKRFTEIVVYTVDGNPSLDFFAFFSEKSWNVELHQNCDFALNIDLVTDNSTMLAEMVDFIKEIMSCYTYIKFSNPYGIDAAKSAIEDAFDIEWFTADCGAMDHHVCIVGTHGAFGILNTSELMFVPCPENVVVRKLTTDDNALLQSLNEDEWDGINAWEYSSFEKSGYEGAGLFVDGQFAGYILYYLKGENTCNIQHVFVHTYRRRHGYGRQLVQFYARMCTERGILPFYGHTETEASAMIARTMGYREMGYITQFGIINSIK